MGFLTRHAYVSLLAAASVAALACVGGDNAFAAAGDDAAPSASQKAGEAAKRLYEAGLKSYKSGKHQPAIDSFSAALRGGGLNSSEMARALYTRGLAYKKLNKPGLAISDLTSALWLKNGLNDADRKNATAERAEAYKMAGLGEGNSGPDQVDVSDPNVPAAPSVPDQTAPTQAVPTQAAGAPQPAAPADQQQQAVAPVTQPAPARQESGVPQPLSMFGDATPPPPPPAFGATAVAPSGGMIDQVDALSGTGTGAINQRTAAVAPNPAPTQALTQVAAPVPAPVAAQAQTPTATAVPTPAAPEGKSSIAGFFSNLFSNSSAPDPQQGPGAPTTTASTSQPTTSAANWANTVAGPGSEKPAIAAAPAPAPAKPAEQVVGAFQPPPIPVAANKPASPPAVKGGKFKAHIAAFRSRAQADALALVLSKQHAEALQSRSPTVDEAVIGSMGKFYRVRIGSYATADEPRGLCNTLRNSGYDCLVVSN